jgi:hypothetical protein
LGEKLQIRGPFTHPALKILPPPDTTRPAVVMITGDHKNRARHRTDQLHHLQDLRGRNSGGIKKVAGHEQGIHRFMAGNVADAADDLDTFSLETSLFLRISNPSVGLADLPVSRVKNAGHALP